MVNKIVLLIEDNPDDERLTLRALHRNNVMNEVVVACDGQEALDFLSGEGKFAGRSPTAAPSVILLDLRLPRVGGIEVLRRIRADQHTKGVPVVVLTASDNEDEIRQAYAEGANSYVRKPVDSQEYSDMVQQTVMYWLLLNVPLKA